MRTARTLIHTKHPALAMCTDATYEKEKTSPRKRRRKDQLKIGMLRGIPEKWNLDSNFEIFLKIATSARKQKVDILITPECFLDGYAVADKASTRERVIKSAAQSLDTSKYLKKVSQFAKQSEMYILFCFSLIDDSYLYNSAGLWGLDGNLIGIYHKTHLQNHDLQYNQGPSLPVFSTYWGPIGVMICADRRWPEVPRTLRLKGAKLILNPSYGMCHDANEMWMRTRGFENQAFIAFTHPELSLLIGPKGQVIKKEYGKEPALLVSEINLLEAKDDNHIKDRRPELYHDIIK